MSCLNEVCISVDDQIQDDGIGTSSKMNDKEYDPVTFDILKVNPEDFASQITLGVLPFFKKITAEELSSCAWIRKNKEELAPNILKFTHKFNVICLWTQSSILDCMDVGKRAQVIGHFIKIGKYLLQLNNIYSAFAVVSALLSQPIYRLSRTWMLVNRREKANFVKMTKLFKEDNNFEALRQFTDSRTLPCIPFLGLYLTDIAYCTAVKKKDPQHDYQQDQNINGILRVLASFQDSNYDHLPRITCVQKYIESAEFQKEFLSISEGQLYAKSLEREPESSSKNPLSPKRTFSLPRFSLLSSRSSRGGTPSFTTPSKESPVVKVREKETKQQPPKSLTPNLTQASKTGRFVKGHKKAQSLGNEAMIKGVDNPSFLSTAPEIPNTLLNPADSFDNILSPQSTHCANSHFYVKPIDLSDISDLMFDSTMSSSVLETSARSDFDVHDGILGSDRSFKKMSLTTSTPKKNSFDGRTPRGLRKMMSLRSMRRSGDYVKSPRPKSADKRKISLDNSDEPLLFELDRSEPEIQGVVHRCVIRGPKSKEVLLKYSQRYFLELRQGNLYEFEKKSLVFHANTERDLYKPKPRRVVMLKDGWEVIRGDEDEPNFELHQPSTGRIIRYRCKSLANANEWYKNLVRATKDDIPTSLIHF